MRQTTNKAAWRIGAAANADPGLCTARRLYLPCGTGLRQCCGSALIQRGVALCTVRNILSKHRAGPGGRAGVSMVCFGASGGVPWSALRSICGAAVLGATDDARDVDVVLGLRGRISSLPARRKPHHSIRSVFRIPRATFRADSRSIQQPQVLDPHVCLA